MNFSGIRYVEMRLFNVLHSFKMFVFSLSSSASGASVVAIDNKIEQAMDLVKSHLMYAVREEVEVLKEQIKELYERNSVLERENAVLKSLANSEQLSQLSSQLANPSSTSPQQPLPSSTAPPEGGQPQILPLTQQQPSVSSAGADTGARCARSGALPRLIGGRCNGRGPEIQGPANRPHLIFHRLLMLD
ncbi:hypothetical protein JZ751_025092, partial [Albula glossodonta]